MFQKHKSPTESHWKATPTIIRVVGGGAHAQGRMLEHVISN